MKSLTASLLLALGMVGCKSSPNPPPAGTITVGNTEPWMQHCICEKGIHKAASTDFCEVPKNDTKEACEGGGGTWIGDGATGDWKAVESK